jgi:hypothetical protein
VRPVARFATPAAGLLVLAVFAALYLHDHDAYIRVLSATMQIPWPHPFVDWEAVSSSIRCAEAGVNVFIDNPCYTEWAHAPSNYSPLWLYATFIPSGASWDDAIALSFCALFFLSLAMLPPPRGRGDLVIMLLATISSATAFGVERGNADLLMFLMVIAGAGLAARPLPLRLLGYALFTLAGLLKFYPMAALVLALRERPLAFAAVALAAALALTLLVASHTADIMLMLRNMPAASYYTRQFGAADLPAGLGQITRAALTKLLHASPAAADLARSAIDHILHAGLTLVAMSLAITISARWRLQDAMRGTHPRHAAFFVAGAAIVSACFFAGPNVAYRGIFLLLALPGLLALARDLPQPAPRRAFRATSLAVVYVQWALFIQWLIKAIGLGDIPGRDATFGYVQWICNELAWWGIVTMLLSVVVTFVRSTGHWDRLARLLRHRHWPVKTGGIAFRRNRGCFLRRSLWE